MSSSGSASGLVSMIRNIWEDKSPSSSKQPIDDIKEQDQQQQDVGSIKQNNRQSIEMSQPEQNFKGSRRYSKQQDQGSIRQTQPEQRNKQNLYQNFKGSYPIKQYGRYNQQPQQIPKGNYPNKQYGKQNLQSTYPYQQDKKWGNPIFSNLNYDYQIFTKPSKQQGSQQFKILSTTFEFSKSQNECLNNLKGLKQTLMKEQKRLYQYLSTYKSKLYEILLEEHSSLRRHILDIFDNVLRESEKRIEEVISKEKEPVEVVNIYQLVVQLNKQIDSLTTQLQGENYRQAIAQVTTTNFEYKISQMQNMMQKAQENIFNNGAKLVINQAKLNEVKANINNLIIAEAKSILTNSRGKNKSILKERKPSNKKVIINQQNLQAKKKQKPRFNIFNMNTWLC